MVTDLAALGYQSSPFPHANAVGILVGALNECDIGTELPISFSLFFHLFH